MHECMYADGHVCMKTHKKHKIKIKCCAKRSLWDCEEKVAREGFLVQLLWKQRLRQRRESREAPGWSSGHMCLEPGNRWRWSRNSGGQAGNGDLVCVVLI